MEFNVNHPILFVIAGLIVALVLGQSVFFLVKALKRAKELGMKNTIFYNSSGLDNTTRGNLSTSYDMALLTKYAMQNEIYQEIVKTKAEPTRLKSDNTPFFLRDEFKPNIPAKKFEVDIIREEPVKEIPKEVFTVRDKVEHIRTILLDRKEASFFEMFSSYYTKNELITTFQAMLELLKLQYITVEQNGVFDDITLNLREDRNEELGEIDEYN